MTDKELNRMNEQLNELIGPKPTAEDAYKNELIARYETAVENSQTYPTDPLGRSYWDGSRDTYKSILDNAYPGWWKTK